MKTKIPDNGPPVLKTMQVLMGAIGTNLIKKLRCPRKYLHFQVLLDTSKESVNVYYQGTNYFTN